MLRKRRMLKRLFNEKRGRRLRKAKDVYIEFMLGDDITRDEAVGRTSYYSDNIKLALKDGGLWKRDYKSISIAVGADYYEVDEDGEFIYEANFEVIDRRGNEVAVGTAVFVGEVWEDEEGVYMDYVVINRFSEDVEEF